MALVKSAVMRACLCDISSATIFVTSESGNPVDLVRSAAFALGGTRVLNDRLRTVVMMPRTNLFALLSGGVDKLRGERDIFVA